ncbi:MAG: hypothetical protein V4632_13945 [Pseudomonadota bacterium]
MTVGGYRTAAWSVLVLGLLSGCATGPLHAPPPPMAQTSAASACLDWFRQLDDSIDRAGVRDAGAFRVPEFPHLRSDRFLASFRTGVADNPPAFASWVTRLRTLDAEARAFEFHNLPASVLPDRQAATDRTQACAEVLSREIHAAPQARHRLAANAAVPDDYSEWKRIAGLYWLTRIPFFRGVEAWQTKTERDFSAADSRRLQAGTTVTYTPDTPPAEARAMAAMLEKMPKDALGVPMPGVEETAMLLRAHAPVFEVETAAASDRIGSLYWGQAPVPMVDITRPQAYQRLAFTRYRGQTLIQLVYTIWFSERPRTGALDLLGGALDGVVLRVTLAPDGTPLVVDTIHPCGCYHMFFATALARARPAPALLTEWAFTPASLPLLRPAQRIALRIESGTHYVVDVRVSRGETGTRYRLVDDNSLRSLTLPDGQGRSVFGADGIIAGTERGERFVFWPMGIDNPGAMRQWGRQPTAFVGRRHFDDADLMEKRFEFDLTGAGAPRGD